MAAGDNIVPRTWRGGFGQDNLTVPAPPPAPGAPLPDPRLPAPKPDPLPPVAEPTLTVSDAVKDPKQEVEGPDSVVSDEAELDRLTSPEETAPAKPAAAPASKVPPSKPNFNKKP